MTEEESKEAMDMLGEILGLHGFLRRCKCPVQGCYFLTFTTNEDEREGNEASVIVTKLSGAKALKYAVFWERLVPTGEQKGNQ